MLRQLLIFGDGGIYGDYCRGLKRSDQSSLGKAFGNASITRTRAPYNAVRTCTSFLHTRGSDFPIMGGGGCFVWEMLKSGISPSPLKKVPTGVTV